MSETVQAEATRAEIRLQAYELFAHYGFQNTNIGDIAKRCDMSPGNLYRFYRNKQAIGLAVIRDYFDLVENAMALAADAAGDDPEARIRAFIEVGIAHMAEKLERMPKIVELAEFLCEDADGQALLNEHIAWKRGRIAADLARGAAAGTLKSDAPEADAATLLNALKAFWMPMTLARWNEPETIIPELRAIVDIMFRGLRA